MISESCSFINELNYTVVLEDNGTIIEQRVISSDSCVNGFCETSFVSTSSNSYVVHVTATNGIGLSSGTVQSSIIGTYLHNYCDKQVLNCTAAGPFVRTYVRTYVYYIIIVLSIVVKENTTVNNASLPTEESIPFDVSFSNCETSVLCSYNSMVNCTVQFTQNPDYQDLSEGTLGRLNSPFLLPLMKPTTTFYYQATVTFNSTTIQIRRSFTTGEC